MSPPRHPPDGEWVMECSAELYASLKHGEEFTFLVTLARKVNALKFGVAAHASVKHEVTPAADHQRL